MTKKKKSRKKNKNKFVSQKRTIQELEDSRDGGQIALRGFSYQCLYSCYFILSELHAGNVVKLEGIEDIDKIEHTDEDKNITHIQLKYSAQKQDASFLKDVLKNFLEVYLMDNKRNFKLVYDFTVAKGNLSKLLAKNLDDSATSYWTKVIEQIKAENPSWNWSNFIFQDFIDKLSFEKIKKKDLTNKIEIELIKTYDITTDNISLFANALKVLCYEKMEQRASINKREIDALIMCVKDDISKGPHNPAHNWIKRLDFNMSQVDLDLSYYEGKKATPYDIAMQLPVRRLHLEQEIEDAIQNNRITVIKAPSGQGKTTLALQVSFNLQIEYTVYQLLWCNDAKELGNIIQYFKSRVKLGEKPLILIDNLDSQLSEWNRLAQLLQEEVSYHYKLLITTREDDWYRYSGDLSNVKSIKVIKLALEEKEAEKIYEVLKRANKLHPSISNWRKAWAKVAEKKLLIEYIYLLTHGEMLSVRIAHQIKEISKSDMGKIKCEILRKVCFADVCGIKLSVKKLIASLPDTPSVDYNEVLKSLENEFLIHVSTTEKYLEGLHPVRSQHLIDRLHEFLEINDTALQVAQITNLQYLPKLFAQLPNIITSNKENFYFDIIDALWNNTDLNQYVLALQGLFSGTVMQYFYQNKEAFDYANEHGCLFLLAAELNPFKTFKEFNFTIDFLDNLKTISPDNPNIDYLCQLRDNMPKINLTKTDFYYFCQALFNKLDGVDLFEITSDVASYSIIAYWLYNIDSDFNLIKNIPLQRIWDEKDKYTVDTISSIMYTYFCVNKHMYMQFVEKNWSIILTYLKAATKSLKLYVSQDRKSIHVEYILLLSDIQKANDESVSRLKTICKTLPIFELYCADAIKPKLNFLSGYKLPDDAHKTMPIRNIVIMFHQDLASLWLKTIMSNYECDTISEWLEYWFSVRKNIAILFEKSSACICRMLEGKQLGNLGTDVVNLRIEIAKKLHREYKYPHENRPFEEKAKISDAFSKVKSDYFQNVLNYSNQFAGFLRRDTDQVRLAMVNLRFVQNALDRMQTFFEDICNEQGIFEKQHAELCMLEKERLEYLIMACMYYQEHQPSKYFDKYHIKTWYNENYLETLKNTQCALSASLEEYNVIFPNKYYYDRVLSYYPVIVHNLDVTENNTLMDFLYHCIPFAETMFDFLIVLCRNSQGQIMPTGLRISRKFFADFKQLIETNDSALAEKLTPPFPIAITSQMLNCFESKYEILTPKVTGYEGFDKVGELLWAYSKKLELLTDECDAEYRDSTINKLKSEILNVLASYKERISPNDYEEILTICEAVFNGQVFDDAKFEEFCEKFIFSYIQRA